MKYRNTAKKLMLTSAILACFGSTVSRADWDEESSWESEPPVNSRLDSRESNWGMGGGAIAGVAAGGPAGFLVGAIAGKFIGAHYGMERAIEEREAEVASLRSKLVDQEKKLSSLENEKVSMQQEMSKHLQVASLGNAGLLMPPSFEKLLQGGMAFNVNFKTNSDQIENHLIEPCRSIAKALKHFPKLKVKLQGYADARGNDKYNLSLSLKRIEAVRVLLEESGVGSQQIIVSNEGESGSLNLGNDQDSYAFDRRVLITFVKEGV